MSLPLLTSVTLVAAVPPRLIERCAQDGAGRSPSNVATDALRAAETRP